MNVQFSERKKIEKLFLLNSELNRIVANRTSSIVAKFAHFLAALRV